MTADIEIRRIAGKDVSFFISGERGFSDAKVSEYERKHGARKVLNWCSERFDGEELNIVGTSYVGSEKEISFHCNLVTYGANVAMLDGAISPHGFNILGVEGVMSSKDGIIVGVRGGDAYSAGKVAVMPSGLVYYDDIKAGPTASAAFYKQLEDETGLSRSEVSATLTGLVKDNVNRQTAVIFDYSVDLGVGEIIYRQKHARHSREYGMVLTFKDHPAEIADFIAGFQGRLNPHDFGALLLHGGLRSQKETQQPFSNKMMYNHRRNGLMELSVSMY